MATNFLTKLTQISWDSFGFFQKHQILSNNCSGYLRQLLKKFGLLFMPTSGHTGHASSMSIVMLSSSQLLQIVGNGKRWHYALFCWSFFALLLFNVDEKNESGSSLGFLCCWTVWPDWALYRTLDNFLKPLATINLPQFPTFVGNFCKGVKIYHFS